MQGPFFNDEFGDTYTNIYAFTGDGFSYKDLKDYGDRVRAELLRVPDVAKVDIIGDQDEKIYVEMSNTHLALLGVDPRRSCRCWPQQNTMCRRRRLRDHDRSHLPAVRAALSSRSTPSARSASRPTSGVFRLGDIADVYRAATSIRRC